MISVDMFFGLVLGILICGLLNKCFARPSARFAPLSPHPPPSVPSLPPPLTKFLLTLKQAFRQQFPEAEPVKRDRGRPRLKRLPFFLVWAWNRVSYHAPPAHALYKVNGTSDLRAFFELPPDGLKLTTYEDFVKYELMSYLESLIQENLTELKAKHLIKGAIIGLDDFPVGSPLNLSKGIDFERPTPTSVQQVFQALGPLTEVDEIVGKPPNSQRGWSDYLKLYLVFLLWGFPSQKRLDQFLKSTPDLATWLQLERGKVLSGTIMGYIRQLEEHPRAEHIQQVILKTVCALSSLTKRISAISPLTELGMLRGVLGNAHLLKDLGASLHYNASKGKYYLGRVGRILADTWSQLPIWAQVLSASQPLAQDVRTFGTQVTQLCGPWFKPLVLLVDHGFRGIRQLAALRESLPHLTHIFLTAPYRRHRQGYDIFRAERTAVERTIGHLTVHLQLEHPRQLGPEAATGWVLGAVFLLQRIALYNHAHHPERSPLSLTHLKYS